MTKKEFDALIIKVQDLYTKDLIKDFAVTVTPFLTKNRTFFEREGLDVNFLAKKHGQLIKLDLLKMLIMPYYSAEIYQQFLDTLNKKQRKVWDYVVMCGATSNFDIEKDLGIKMGEMQRNVAKYSYWRDEVFYIIKGEYTFLPRAIRPSNYSYYSSGAAGANFLFVGLWQVSNAIFSQYSR